MGEFLATVVGLYAGICGTIWVVFRRLEGVVKEGTLIRIADWIRGNGSSDTRPRWPAEFVRLFDRLFGEKHLSLRCFGVSSLGSILFVVLLTLYGYLFSPVVRDMLVGLISDPVLRWQYGIAFLILNLFPDYLSLLETRSILRRIEAVQERLDWLKWLGWLAIDTVATALIILSAMLALGLIFQRIHPSIYAIYETWDAFTQGLSLLVAGSDTNSVVGIFIYSTFLTSIWIWLYAFSGVVIRIAYKTLGLRTVMDQHLKLDKQPLSIMAGLLVGLITVIYWPAVGYWYMSQPTVP